MIEPSNQAMFSWLLSGALVAPPTGPAPAVVPPPPSPAPATTPAEASVDTDFAEAERLYIDGKILEAISAYQRLFLRTGEPVCLANIGRLYEERGEFDLAADLYRKFLLHPRADTAQREQVRARLQELAPSEPLPIVLPSEPTELAAQAPSPAPPRAEEPARRRPGRPLQVSGGLLMALAVPGVVLGGLMSAQADDLRATLARTGYDTWAGRSAAEQEVLRKHGATVGLLVGGSLAAAIGLTLAIVGGRRAAQAKRKQRLGLHATGLRVSF